MYPPASFVPAPSQNDRLMSAACHLSSLVGFGVIGPLVIYFTQRERSGFVARHALQALFLQLFHLCAVVVAVLGIFVVAGASMYTLSAGHAPSGGATAAVVTAWVMLAAAVGVPTLLYLLFMVLGVIEAMQSKEANLPVLGALARSFHKG